jgi:hypothetical protein
MKLVRQNKDGRAYQLNQKEADCLRSLLQQFPITANVPAQISRTDADPETVEREKLLNESLAEHRNELKQQATNLLAAKKFKKVEKGYWLTLNLEEHEILLQILNDIRVGSWRMLGEPEDLELETPPPSERELVFYTLMNLAGYFEAALLHAVNGDLQPGHD